jgi:uncharacterized membrane protein YdjX (TVP38/TMEM64 family)
LNDDHPVIKSKGKEVIAVKKGLVVCLYLLLIVIAVIYKSEILHMLQNRHLPLILAVLIAAFFSFSSIVPYSLVIGLLGFVYGSLWGACISWAGSLIASVLFYSSVRFLFKEKGRLFLSRFRLIKPFTEAARRSPFLTILTARFIPFFPQNLVNSYAAIAPISFIIFLLASAVGKIPIMLLYAFIGGNAMKDWTVIVPLVGAYTLLALAVYRFFGLRSKGA